MKTTKIFFIAAAAVAMTLASCTKELNGNNEENNQSSELRTLTIGFADSDTRTTLASDGLQPVWAKGDQITISNGSTTEPVNVPDDAEGQTSFTVITTLKGTLTVYYPGGDKYDTYWSNGDVKIPASQTGEFADANVCSGSVNEDGTNLTLYNKTAIIKVNVPTGTKKLTLTSLNPISDGQRAESGAVNIADGSTTIVVDGGSNNIPSPCYVSILAPASGAVLLQDLNVDVEYSEDKKAQGGFSPSAITAKGETPSTYAVVVNTIYTLSKESLHEYVTVDGKKWATQNVAVTASGKREFGNTGLVNGDYFQWASHAGYCGSASDSDGGFLIYSSFTNKKCGDSKDEFTFKSGVGRFGPRTYFDGEVAWSPYCNNATGNYDSKYSTSTKTRLDLDDDAAFYFWGGAWRMPKVDDFSNLLSKTGTNEYNFDTSLGVLKIKGKDLSFPAAGYGDGTALNKAGERGAYWSSSLDTDISYNAFCLDFSDMLLIADSFFNRNGGFSVRPLSE